MNKETEAEVLRLFHAEGWRPNTIARQLGLHHSAVARVLARNGVLTPNNHQRKRKVDEFVPFIVGTLEKYPKLNATRLYQMVKERGYGGGVDHFRDIVASLRPTPKGEAFLKLATLPGEQAQCDWANFGKLKVGSAERRLLAFVMVLSWSRRIFLRFYFADGTANFLRGHVEAFEQFQSVPREILYDNLKSAVLERVGSAIRFNPDLLALAAHYRFAPKPVPVARANEKGRVERAINYVRSSFFSARQFSDIDDLNAQALTWCEKEALQRQQPQGKGLTVAEAFEAERNSLLSLPDAPFPVVERKSVQAGKTPYIRFDLNDYSVPYQYANDRLIVEATLDAVSISNGREIVATHKRTFDKGLVVENPEHVKELEGFKRQARKHRAVDRIRNVVPSAQEYFRRAAEQGHNLGRLTQLLIRMLDLYGAVELEVAVAETLAKGPLHSATIQRILEKRRTTRGLPPPVPVQFAQRKVQELTIVPGSLAKYDDLLKEEIDQ